MSSDTVAFTHIPKHNPEDGRYMRTIRTSQYAHGYRTVIYSAMHPEHPKVTVYDGLSVERALQAHALHIVKEHAS